MLKVAKNGSIEILKLDADSANKKKEFCVMVKTILGMKGSGKTKKLVDLVIEAVNEANGDVVVIEKDRKLTFDIPYQARLNF